jgi:hypothetical protein
MSFEAEFAISVEPWQAKWPRHRSSELAREAILAAMRHGEAGMTVA